MSDETSKNSSEAARYQDSLIAAALPEWLRAARVEQLQALRDASKLSLHWRQRCQALLATLQGVAAFCQPLLQQSLAEQLPAIANVSVTWRMGYKEPVVTSVPIGFPVSSAEYRSVSLLEAAMRNFTAEQSEAGGMLAGNRLELAAGAEAALPTPEAFAGFCRRLDLGEQYQRHVRTVLEPAGEAGVQVQQVLAQHHRYALLVDVHRAWIQGWLNEEEHQALERLCALHTPLTLRGDPLQVRRLKLLGCTLEQIVVLDVRDESWSPLVTSSREVFVYIPGDPVAPLRRYASLRHFANDLGKRLRTADYQRFFARFVRRRDSQRFFSAVIEGYADVSDLANISLDEHLTEWPEGLFDSLAKAQIARTKDDATLIATPVSKIDLDVQHEHDQRLKAEGWTLINLAGLFIPGVGLALLGITAWQLLEDVYLGVQAWREGDDSEAMDHLYNVALQLASVAAIAAGTAVVISAWKRSKIVDSLIPALLPEQRLRLYKPDVRACRSEPALDARIDDQGISRSGQRAWVPIDGHHYEAVQNPDDQSWALRERDGHAPALVHNGAGAWRLGFEQPLEWDDDSYLFRRMAITEWPLEDEQIGLILKAADCKADELRALHVQGRRADAILCEVTLRVELDARIRQLIMQLRSAIAVSDHRLLSYARALPESAGLADQALADLLWGQRREFLEQVYPRLHESPTATASLLLRDFPGLGGGCAQELVDASSADVRGQMLETGRVPLPLAEAARRLLRRRRVMRACQGFFVDGVQTPDLARVAVGMSVRLPGAPGNLAWRLFEGSRDTSPLFVTDAPAGARVLDLVHREKGFELFDAQGASLAQAPGELFETLAIAYDENDRQALGVAEPFAHNLRVIIGRQTLAAREQVAQLLGQTPPASWFRLPVRLAEGRLGYPLSGRGRGPFWPQALRVRLRRFYPSLSDFEIEQWAQRVRQSGEQIERVLGRLAGEMRSLQTTLSRWVASGTELNLRIERNRFSDQLLLAWRRMTPQVLPSAEQGPSYRLHVHGISLQSLPTFPSEVNFAHVQVLSLRSLGLAQVPSNFMLSFPAVRVLELGGNQLTRLPAGLDLLSDLTELSLEGNQIVLDNTQITVLSRCERLRSLNLSHNPLQRSFSVQRMNGLRNLNLRAIQLPALPEALLGRFELNMADLRDNLITELPDRMFLTARWISDSILLDNNPLSPASAARLEEYRQVRLPDTSAGTGAARGRWLDTLSGELRAERAQTWDMVEALQGSQGFFELLHRLQDSADFSNDARALGLRVWAMIEAIRAHSTLGEELFALAGSDLTCQDSAALRFSALEVRMLVWQARITAEATAVSEESALIQLGYQLWRLDEVDRIALRDIEQRRAQGADPDQIEISLAYRTGLRESLDLPAQPQDMLFAAVSGVDQARLDRALDEVKAAETPENLARSLVQRDFWQTWLQRTHSQRLEVLDEPFQARLAALVEEAEHSEGGEDGYVARMNAVRDERQAAHEALMVTLTLQTLETHTIDR